MKTSIFKSVKAIAALSAFLGLIGCGPLSETGGDPGHLQTQDEFLRRVPEQCRPVNLAGTSMVQQRYFCDNPVGSIEVRFSEKGKLLSANGASCEFISWVDNGCETRYACGGCEYFVIWGEVYGFAEESEDGWVLKPLGECPLRNNGLGCDKFELGLLDDGVGPCSGPALSCELPSLNGTLSTGQDLNPNFSHVTHEVSVRISGGDLIAFDGRSCVKSQAFEQEADSCKCTFAYDCDGCEIIAFRANASYFYLEGASHYYAVNHTGPGACPEYDQIYRSCTPDCTGKACGNDGCGGSCGSCTEGQSCVSGECAGGGDGSGVACNSDYDCPPGEYCPSLVGLCQTDPCDECISGCAGMPGCCTCGYGCECASACFHLCP